MPFIKQFLNGDTVNVIAFESSLTVGRALSNDIVIDDPTVSQLHARVTNEGDSWLVKDCDSTNGILVDGKKQSEFTLKDGCSFTVGTQVLEFSLSEPQALDKTLRIKKSWIPGVYYTE